MIQPAHRGDRAEVPRRAHHLTIADATANGAQDSAIALFTSLRSALSALAKRQQKPP